MLDSLRGLAALSVCIFHFTNWNPNFLPDGFLKAAGSKGALGVQVFFVISGFVIPYALHTAEYELGNYWRFVLKRILRLDPPYVVSIILTLLLGYLAASAPGFQGPPFQPGLTQVLLHLGYANVFFGYPWLNGVYWTLAIELQYYLLIGLLFPFLGRLWLPLFAIFALLAVAVPSERFIFHYLFLFMSGMLTYRYLIGLMTRVAYFGGLAALGIGVYLTLGGWVLAVGLSTALGIAFVQLNPLRFFGNISYSLYLVHVPIGVKLVHLSMRFTQGVIVRLSVVVVALGLSTLFAYLLYVLVEKPSQRLAGRILYHPAMGQDLICLQPGIAE